MPSHRYTLQIHAGPDSYSQVCGAQGRKGKALKGWANLIASLISGSHQGGQIDVAVDDGGGGTAASQTVTYGGTVTGAQTIVISGRSVAFTAVNTNPTATALVAIAAIQADAVASRLVSATNVAGVVTVKAKTLPASHTLANGATLTATGTGATAGGATLTGGVNSTDAGYVV